jgi:GT2 family glycosyltransferase
MPVSSFLLTQNFKNYKARLSAGLWIKRSLFLEMGGLDVNLSLDEDTDLCCRLMARGHIPYYSRMIGVIYSRNDGEIRLTNSTEKNVTMACYLRTLEKNFDPLKPVKGDRDYLLHRTHKFISETGNFSYLRAFDKFQKPKIISVIFFFRILKYRMKNFLHPPNART